MTVFYGDGWPNPTTATIVDEDAEEEVGLVFLEDGECEGCHFYNRYEPKVDEPCLEAPCAKDTRTDGKCGSWVRK